MTNIQQVTVGGCSVDYQWFHIHLILKELAYLQEVEHALGKQSSYLNSMQYFSQG